VEIRAANPKDLKEIEGIEKASFNKDAYHRELLEAFLKEPRFLTLVAESDGVLVAYGTLFEEEGSSTRLVTIAVRPVERNQGLAKKLMRRLEDIALEKGSKRMTLEVGVTNVAAVNLYLGFGFRIRGTIPDYYGKQKDAFYMEKGLRPRTP